MKRRILIFVSVLSVGFIMLLACEEIFTSEDKGKQASEEFCACMKEHTLSKCEDELNSKYSSYTNDDKFIKAFNDANNCDITISKKK